jgi:hypothetical protein
VPGGRVRVGRQLGEAAQKGVLEAGPEQQGRGGVAVGAGADAAATLFQAQVAGQRFHWVLRTGALAGDRGMVRGQQFRLGEDRRADREAGLVKGDRAAGGAGQPAGQAFAGGRLGVGVVCGAGVGVGVDAGGQGAEGRAQAGQAFLEHSQEQVGLVLEVLVQGGFGVTGGAGDLLGRSAGEAARPHHVGGRVEDAAPGVWHVPP